MFQIVRREEMSQGNVVLNEIEAPLIAKKAKPGQFVILKANETARNTRSKSKTFCKDNSKRNGNPSIKK